MRKKVQKQNASDAVKRRIALSTVDREAVSRLQARHGSRTFSDAIRLCIRQQAIRDSVLRTPKGAGTRKAPDGEILIGGTPDPEVYEKTTGLVFNTVLPDRAKRKRSAEPQPLPFGAELKQLLLRLWPQEEEALKGIIQRWGLAAVVDAVRFAIRVQSELERVAPPGSRWL